MIGIHPQAVLSYPNVPPDLRREIEAAQRGYADPKTFYVEKLAEGIATLGAAFAPKPVIVRLSDFKSNEYSSLLGGQRYEPHEENPDARLSRRLALHRPELPDCFELECQALKRVRDDMGLTNVEIMVPFVRTVSEAKQVIELLAEPTGCERGRNGLRVIMMCEIPSNALLAEQFLQHFDGFSIGSNDMTQLTLGVDRDSGIVAGSLRRARPGGEGACCTWRSRPAARRASTSASADRDLPTIPISPSGWWSRASTRFRSIPTRWSRPGCSWRARRRCGTHETACAAALRRSRCVMMRVTD